MRLNGPRVHKQPHVQTSGLAYCCNNLRNSAGEISQILSGQLLVVAFKRVDSLCDNRTWISSRQRSVCNLQPSPHDDAMRKERKKCQKRRLKFFTYLENYPLQHPHVIFLRLPSTPRRSVLFPPLLDQRLSRPRCSHRRDSLHRSPERSTSLRDIVLLLGQSRTR